MNINKVRRQDAVLRWCVSLALALLACFGYLMTSAHTDARVEIAPAPDRNPLSSGNDLSVILPGKVAGSVSASGWTRANDTFSTVADTGNAATPMRWSSQVTSSDLVGLVASPKGGALDIVVNGKRTHLDLYDPFGKTFYIKVVSLAPIRSIVSAGNVTSALVVFIAVLALLWPGLKYALPPPVSATHAHGALNTAYLARLDHLRFVAAALVLLYHFFHDYVGAGYRSHFPLAAIVADGHTGVALFMVLSGFIFAHIGRGKEINYKNFLLARIVRIFPLYIFALAVAFSTKRWDFKPFDILLFAVPMVNFYSLVSVPYFGQLWTIGVEFQFYSVFPFLNKFANARGPRYLVGLLMLFVLIRLCYFNLYGDARDFGYWTILGRMDQFIVGMLAAIIYNRQLRIFSNVLAFPATFAAALAVMTLFNVHFGGYSGTAGSALWIVWPTIEAVVWGAFALAYLSWRVRIPAGVDGLLAKFGAISFSIYVMQYVAIPQLQRYIGVVPFSGDWNLNVFLSGVLFAIPAVLLLSGLTYSLIERPFFAFKFRYVSQSGNEKEDRKSVSVAVDQGGAKRLQRVD